MEESYIRYENFKKELAELERGRLLDYKSESFVFKGIIKSFEVVLTFAWKSMKEMVTDYYGYTDYELDSPRSTIEAAYKMEIIEDAGVWLSMLKDRNILTHKYDGEIAREKVETIINEYYFEFMALEKKIDSIIENSK